MKVNLTTMRQKDGANISGISYSLRGRAVDKSPPSHGARRGWVLKVSLMFLDLIQRKWLNFQYKKQHRKHYSGMTTGI